MATISAETKEKVYSVPKWLGLNEHPDGDTRLKLGEASKMINWKVTRDGNLKRRPGSEIIAGLCTSYSISISPNIERIMSFENENEKLVVYSQTSAARKPGVVSLVGYSGSVEKGVWQGIDATIEDGVMTESLEHAFVISGGVLKMQNDVDGDEMTVAALIQELSELEEGEFLYVETTEAPYAINADCVSREDGKIILGGFLLSAVPSETSQPVAGMWSGYAGGKPRFLAACNGKIWSLWNPTTQTFTREYLGDVATNKGVNFIPFGGDIYIQNGYEYYVYNGTSVSVVDGYIPLVCIAIGPLDTDTDGDSTPDTASNAGELTGELVNRLTPKRRVWISPDGTNTTFQMPETGLKSIDNVIDLTTGYPVVDGWTSDPTNGTITFTTAPAKAVNSYEVQYSAFSHSDTGHSDIPDYRAQVTGCLYSELYSGNTDSGLFFYGDGTNRILYTGMDYDGMPRADYFPDQYEARIGDSNTPVTNLVRHYSELVCYKPRECYTANYGTVELATGDLTTAIYITPVNRDKGNEALGQVRLVNNNPVTCCGGELYHWVNNSRYTSNLTRDERQAKRISDRIQASIKELDLTKCIMWDDNDNQEFYVVHNGIALVWNYAVDVWYRYNNFPAVRMCNFQGDVFIGTPDGLILRLTYDKQTDAGTAIKAKWESGAIDFGASHLRKYSSTLWVGLKPEKGTSVDVCVETDRKNTFKDKVASSEKAKIAGQPFAVRSKIKAKKFVYYRLLLSVEEIMPAVTVTNVDIRVRQTGYAK